MLIVTALESDPRSGGVRIQLDGQPFATVAQDDVISLRLMVGLPVTPAQRETLERCAEVQAARAVALRLLGARGLPQRELVRRLTRKGHSPAAVEQAVGGLVAAGLLDDAQFAEHFARTRARRGLGPIRLIGDLRRMGVEERLAQEAVAQAYASEGVDPDSELVAAARRKARSLKGLDRDRQVRRLRTFLVRRGFPVGQVRTAVQQVLALNGGNA